MKYVYKIIAALGALAVIPIIVFSKTIFYRIESAALSAVFYIGQLLGNKELTDFVKGNNGVVPESIADSNSLYELAELFSSMSNGEETDLSKFESLIGPVSVFAIVLVLIAICAVVTAVLAVVAKDNRKVIYSSVAGIGLSLMARECFEAVAAPIVDGTINFGTLLDSSWATLLGSFETVSLSTNFWFIPLAFVAVIVWTILYNYTLPEDEKEARKLMIKELDEK